MYQLVIVDEQWWCCPLAGDQAAYGWCFVDWWLAGFSLPAIVVAVGLLRPVLWNMLLVVTTSLWSGGFCLVCLLCLVIACGQVWLKRCTNGIGYVLIAGLSWHACLLACACVVVDMAGIVGLPLGEYLC